MKINEKVRIKELQKKYYSISEILILDDDLKEQFTKEEDEIKNCYDDEYVKWIMLENNISNYLCEQIFRHCENFTIGKCSDSQNISKIYCMFCTLNPYYKEMEIK
jgi:hypothetical protein